MPDSQNPDHTLKLIKEFQLKGGNLIPTVTGEIVPVVLVSDLTQSRQDKRSASGGAATAATVAKVGQHQLFNPSGSGVILELRRFMVSLGAADLVYFGPSTIQFATTITGQWIDRRPNSGQPVAQISTSILSALPTLINPGIMFISTTATVLSLPVDAVLVPGSGFQVETANVNAAVYTNWQWYERPALPGEI